MSRPHVARAPIPTSHASTPKTKSKIRPWPERSVYGGWCNRISTCNTITPSKNLRGFCSNGRSCVSMPGALLGCYSSPATLRGLVCSALGQYSGTERDYSLRHAVHLWRTAQLSMYTCNKMSLRVHGNCTLGYSSSTVIGYRAVTTSKLMP